MSAETLRLGLVSESLGDAEIYVNSRHAKFKVSSPASPPTPSARSTSSLYELSEPLNAQAVVIEVATEGEKFAIDYADIEIKA